MMADDLPPCPSGEVERKRKGRGELGEVIILHCLLTVWCHLQCIIVFVLLNTQGKFIYKYENTCNQLPTFTNSISSFAILWGSPMMLIN